MGKHKNGKDAAKWLALAFGFICFFALLTSVLTISFSAAEEVGPASPGDQAGSSVTSPSDDTSSDAEATETSDAGTDDPGASSKGSDTPDISETDSTAGEQPASDTASSDLPATDAPASNSSENSSSQETDGSNPPASQTETDSSSATPETDSTEGTSTSPATAEPLVEVMEAESPAPVIGNVDVPGYFPYDTSVGGFVFECENLYGNDFFAVKIDESTPVPKADVSMFNVSSNGFRLFKNLNDASFGDYCWALTADNMFTLASNLNINTSEMYAEQLLDISGTDNPVLFPPDYWTTEPENDLVSRLNGTPIQAIQGSDTKFNTHLYRATQITFNNFILSVEPGHQTSYAE